MNIKCTEFSSGYERPKEEFQDKMVLEVYFQL